VDDARGPERPREPAAEEDGGLVAVPGFAGGGRVERTGIALVHEREWIVPEPGSEALIEPLAGSPAVAGDREAATDAGQVVSYHFPVEVELVGELSEEQRRALADQVYEEIDTALQGQG
jgi:hypothetical protein